MKVAIARRDAFLAVYAIKLVAKEYGTSNGYFLVKEPLTSNFLGIPSIASLD